MIGKTIGQYQVIDKIGEGGMGAVYKAENTTLHRLVALKTLSTHLAEDEETYLLLRTEHNTGSIRIAYTIISGSSVEQTRV